MDSTIVSQKSANGQSTLQVRQREVLALLRELPHLTMKELPVAVTSCPARLLTPTTRKCS